MKKIFTLAVVGLTLSALVGCSSSNTSASASNPPSSQQTDQAAQSGAQGAHKGQGMKENQELLTLLKIDSKTLQDEFKAGKSLADIAQEKGVPEQQVIDLMIKQSEQRTDEAVQSGKITKDKADQMKANEADRIKQQVEHKGGFGGNGQGNQQRHQKNDQQPANSSNNS